MMFNRLRVIWLNYATRKTNWALFLLGGVLMVLAWNGTKRPTFKRVTPQKSTRWLSEGTLREAGMGPSGPQARVLAGRWDWSEWNVDLEVLNMGPFYSPGLEGPWERISSMPNLRQLRVEEFQSAEMRFSEFFEPIARLQQLEYLSLPGVPFAGESVAAWESLTQLEWLVANASGFTLTDGLESLPVFPSLHTLDIHLSELTPEAAEYLVKLPKLRTLILHDLEHQFPRVLFDPTKYDDPKRDASAEAFETLAESKSLKYLYVAGREFGGLEDLAKKTLPNVHVRPIYLSDQQSEALLLAIFGAISWALIPALAVFSQFARPESVLTPSYKQPHLVHASLCILFAITVATAVASLRLVAWPMAFATISCVVGLAVFCVGSFKAWWTPFFYVFIFLQSLVMPYDAVKIWLREFYRGDSGWFVAFVLATSGIGMLITWMRGALCSHRTNAELGLSRSWTMFDLKWSTLSRMGKDTQSMTQTQEIMQRSVDSEVRKSIRGFRRSDAVARRRLLAAPNYGPTTWIILLFALANVSILGFRFYRTGTTALDATVSGTIVILALYATVGCVVVVQRKWFNRRPFFASELCRPCVRNEYINDIFLLSRNHVALPVLGVCAVQATLACVSCSNWLQAPAGGLALAVLLIGTATLFHAVGLWAVTLGRDWLLVVTIGVMIGAVFAIFVAVSSLSDLLGSKGFFAHPLALVVVGVAAFLSGCAVLAYARTCWEHLEFATLVRSSRS